MIAVVVRDLAAVQPLDDHSMSGIERRDLDQIGALRGSDRLK